MAIPAQRFKVLDNETNLPSSTFGASRVNDIINTASNELKPIIDEAADLIRTSVPEMPDSVRSLFSSAKDAFSEYSRDIKSIAGMLTDYKGAPEGLVKSLVDGFAGAGANNTVVSKSMVDMLRRCGRGSAYGFGGRPYDVSANCSGGKAGLGRYGTGNGCNSSSYTDLLNRLSGGAYNKGFSDIGSALRSLMSLAGYGYKLGLCGVFNTLYTSNVFSGLGLGNLEFGKAAGSLLGIVGNAGNTRAWIDIAKSSTGLFPKMTNPAALDELLGNFALPDNLPEINQVELMEQLRGGQELYDEKWMYGDDQGWGNTIDGVPVLTPDRISMAHMDGVTDDYRELSETWVTNRAYGEDELDVIPDSDEDSYYSAVAASESSDSEAFAEIW